MGKAFLVHFHCQPFCCGGIGVLLAVSFRRLPFHSSRFPVRLQRGVLAALLRPLVTEPDLSELRDEAGRSSRYWRIATRYHG